jgi:hypothetical protein
MPVEANGAGFFSDSKSFIYLTNHVARVIMVNANHEGSGQAHVYFHAEDTDYVRRRLVY